MLQLTQRSMYAAVSMLFWCIHKPLTEMKHKVEQGCCLFLFARPQVYSLQVRLLSAGAREVPT